MESAASPDAVRSKEVEKPLQKDATGSEEVEDPAAQAYLDHLLTDGALEGDSGAELDFPPWYNERMFKQGQTYIQSHRFVITSGMLAGLVAVMAIPSIVRVLKFTHQSSKASTAYRRYIRTILHTNAWYDFPITWKNSKFWTSIKTVRKAHMRVSKASSKNNNGLISQKDLAITQFAFFGFITLGAPRIQLYDKEMLETTAHMWRVLGYLLGIKDEYNICGETWEETKPRLEIVMRKVYAPALAKTDDDFTKLTKALIDGLQAVNSSLTFGSYVFFTKRLACVKGYEFFSFDHPDTKRDPSQKSYFYDLSWWDRYVVTYGLYVVTYLHKYSIVRWYLNFNVWLSNKIMYYFPYMGIWRYGWKWAIVRIFNTSEREDDFELHSKVE